MQADYGCRGHGCLLKNHSRSPDAAQRVALAKRCAAEPGPPQSQASSCAGLTRASIHLRKSLSKKMDCRVKPGNDGSVRGTVPALRSSVKNAAARPGHASRLAVRVLPRLGDLHLRV